MAMRLCPVNCSNQREALALHARWRTMLADLTDRLCVERVKGIEPSS